MAGYRMTCWYHMSEITCSHYPRFRLLKLLECLSYLVWQELPPLRLVICQCSWWSWIIETPWVDMAASKKVDLSLASQVAIRTKTSLSSVKDFVSRLLDPPLWGFFWLGNAKCISSCKLKKKIECSPTGKVMRRIQTGFETLSEIKLVIMWEDVIADLGHIEDCVLFRITKLFSSFLA